MAPAFRKRNLERLTQRGDVVRLREIMVDQDLQRSADGAVVDRNGQRRIDAVRALGEIDDLDAENAIVEALNDRVGSVRHVAVEVLAARASPTALPRLAYVCATWSDPGDRARLAALDLLEGSAGSDSSAAVSYADGLIATDSSFPPDDLDKAAIQGFAQTEAAARMVTDFLAGALASDDRERVDRSATILGWLGPAAVAAVESAALQIHGAGRGGARALGRLGQERSVTTLSEVLERGARMEDRLEAAIALADLRTPLAIEPLMRATRDSDRAVRDAALAGLDSYGTMATVAMIGGVIGPGLDAVLQLGRTDRTTSPSVPPPSEPEGWRGVVRGLLARP